MEYDGELSVDIFYGIAQRAMWITDPTVDTKILPSGRLSLPEGYAAPQGASVNTYTDGALGDRIVLNLFLVFFKNRKYCGKYFCKLTQIIKPKDTYLNILCLFYFSS